MTHALSRRDHLNTRAVGDDLVVHDTLTDRWHTLDATSSAVFNAADGTRDEPALAAATGLDAAAVAAALAALAEADLVAAPSGISRRALLTRGAVVGGAALVVPMVSSLYSPVAAAAASGGGGTGGGGTGGGGTTELVTNGGFEAGSFTGWTEVDQSGGDGSWFVYSGTSAPESGLPQSAPPEGTFAATSDQNGPGSHLLFQDVTLPAGSTPQLAFSVFYTNYGGDFFTPNSLDYNDFPNEQLRVDILDPAVAAADPFTLTVLATPFRTVSGDPQSIPPTTTTFDLTPFAGQTVRIRFAEADNQGFFTAGVDKVSVIA